MIRTFTVLGGGSAYTPGLLQALIHHGEGLGLETVRLYDLDEARVELVARLGAGLAREAGSRLRVEATPTLEAALAGTNVVLNSTRPGGLESRQIDETLPLAFGIPGQETVGPGGFFYALRSVPEALHVAGVLARVAPDAVLLNYTNPSNIVTQALLDAGHARVLGLCDQSAEDLHTLAAASGLPQGTWRFDCNGLNHATWYRALELEGRPWTPPAVFTTPADLDAEHQLRFELSKAMAAQAPGFWPNSYLPYYLHPDPFVALAREAPSRAEVILAKLPTYYAHFREEAAKEHPVLRLHRGSAGFGDLAVLTLQALNATTPCRLVLNLANEGITPVFARDTVVEAPVRLDAGGLAREPAGDLPAAGLDLLRRLEDYQRLAAEAAVRGGGARLGKALAANPLVQSLTQAEAILTEARQRYGGRIEALA